MSVNFSKHGIVFDCHNQLALDNLTNRYKRLSYNVLVLFFVSLVPVYIGFTMIDECIVYILVIFLLAEILYFIKYKEFKRNRDKHIKMLRHCYDINWIKADYDLSIIEIHFCDGGLKNINYIGVDHFEFKLDD